MKIFKEEFVESSLTIHNPLWHKCLVYILSARYRDIVVVDNWIFFRNNMSQRLKSKLKFVNK